MKKNRNIRSLLRRSLILALVAILSVGLFACGSDDDDDYGSSYVAPVVSPYVSMVKNAKHSTYGITYGAAFNSFFSNPEWSYFKASTGEDVVEFEGRFSYSGSPATAKIQFVVDTSAGTFTAYHLSIDGEAQSKLMLATMIQKVFESY